MIPTNLRAQFDRAIVPLVVTVLAVVLMASLTAVALTAVSTAGAASTQSVAGQSAADQPTVDVATTTLADGETATVAVTLSSAPEGLSGYKLDLAVADDAVARIDSVSYPDQFGLTTEPTVVDEGQTVTIEAADLDGRIEPGATNVTLAHVNVTGVEPGKATLAVEPIQFDGDDGSVIDPTTEPGVVTVGAADAGDTTPAGTERANDAGDPAIPADTDAAATTTAADGSLATIPLLAAAGVVLLGIAALRRRE